jgi:hypothetical protein
MKKIVTIIPHATIIMSIMFITLWILDQYNPNMNFLDSKLSNTLLLILFILSTVTSIIAVIFDRKLGRRDETPENRIE